MLQNVSKINFACKGSETPLKKLLAYPFHNLFTESSIVQQTEQQIKIKVNSKLNLKPLEMKLSKLENTPLNVDLR